MVNKKFFVFLVFLIFCVNVNAIVVSDITEQIRSGNDEIIASNVSIQGEMSNVQTSISNVNMKLDVINERMLSSDDVAEFYDVVNARLIEEAKLHLAINIASIIFALLLIYLSKAKGWL